MELPWSPERVHISILSKLASKVQIKSLHVLSIHCILPTQRTKEMSPDDVSWVDCSHWHQVGWKHFYKLNYKTLECPPKPVPLAVTQQHWDPIPGIQGLLGNSSNLCFKDCRAITKFESQHLKSKCTEEITGQEHRASNPLFSIPPVPTILYSQCL